MKEKTMQVINQFDVPFTVRIVEKGDKYGLNNCLTHDEEKRLVEFYDARYKEGFTEHGQFVSSYYEETIVEIITEGNNGGLNLHGGVEKWSVTSGNISEIGWWLLLN